jgi:hypothetical protein
LAGGTLSELPSAWLDAFLAITRSTALASLVVRARYVLGTPDAMSAQEFGEALTQVSFPRASASFWMISPTPVAEAVP